MDVFGHEFDSYYATLSVICAWFGESILLCQDKRANIGLGLAAYFLLRMMKFNFFNTIIKVLHESLPYMVQTFGGASSPFACVSNSLNKPMPLKLDVSLPSFQDIKWSIARLIYLFNVQLERNIAT